MLSRGIVQVNISYRHVLEHNINLADTFIRRDLKTGAALSFVSYPRILQHVDWGSWDQTEYPLIKRQPLYLLS